MKKSLIVVGLILISGMLHAEVIEDSRDLPSLTATDDEGHIIDTKGHVTTWSNHPIQPSCRRSTFTIDGKVVASHEENCDSSNDPNLIATNNENSTAQKKVNF